MARVPKSDESFLIEVATTIFHPLHPFFSLRPSGVSRKFSGVQRGGFFLY